MSIQIEANPRVAEAYKEARQLQPKAVLRLVQMGAAALEEEEETPFVIIRRPSTAQWAAIARMEQANEAAAEAAAKAKETLEPPYNISTEIAKAAIVTWRGTGAEDSLDELFETFYFFAARITAVVWEFSGSVAPLVGSLPKPK